EGLLKELAATRRRGYSVDEEAVREGVCAFGAPVFDATGHAVAGIAVCVNKALLGVGKGSRYRRLALDVAAALSERLGAPPAKGHRGACRGRTAGARRRLEWRTSMADDCILETRQLTKEFKGFVA